MASTQSLLFAFSAIFARIFMMMFLTLLVARVDSQNQSSEVQILLAFESSMGYAIGSLYKTGFQGNWDSTDENPCYWVGVTCTTSYTVVQLDLSGWGLNYIDNMGVLSNLADFRALDFSSNQLFRIPQDIGSLTSVTHIDLSNNPLQEPFQDSTISSCRSLRYLSLQHCQLQSDIPDLSALVNLQVLLLNDNNLTGMFPKQLAEMSGLVRVDLSDNMLNGSIPSLSSLDNLLYLNLENNNFTEFEWPINPDLEYLSVAGNELQGEIPSTIANLSNLGFLNLSRNQLSGSIPSELSWLMNKTFTVDLSQNRLSGQIPVNFLQPSVYPLTFSTNLSYNNLTGAIPLDAAKNYNFFYLDLSHNILEGSFPSSSLGTIIRYFNLSDNRLSGDIVDAFLSDTIGTSQASYDLRLGNNFFTGDLSRMLFDFVGGTGDLPSWYCFQDVEVLDLSNNRLQMSTSKAFPDPLSAFVENIVYTPSKSDIKELRMGGNNFSGTSLPMDIRVPLPIQVMDLSNSHLKGQILDTAFNSTLLPYLQFLDLSNNDVTGPIPKALLLLPNLEVLNVSNNRLYGPLPDILPNSRFYNPSFFLGNKLCDGPLTPCQSKGASVPWWLMVVVVMGSMIMGVASCLVATWRWRAYQKKHQQDEDLIKMLLEREFATLMSLRELKRATNNFDDSARIGEGGFGTVYSGRLNDGTIVAIKRSKREGSERDKAQFLNEVRILSRVNHRHLVKLLGCCMENKIALLVFEFVSNGTLQEHLQGEMGMLRLSWKERLKIAVQTAHALNYLHSATIYHRDVKSANVLLNDDLNAKVADFGISKLAPVEATHVTTVAVQGTFGYLDPEYCTSLQFTNKSDVYSFGVVLLELISAKRPIDMKRDEPSLVSFAIPQILNGDLQQLLDPILSETYSDPTGHGKLSIIRVGRLAINCLNMQAKARPSMNEVWKELQSIWFEFTGTSTQLGSIQLDDDEDPHWTSNSLGSINDHGKEGSQSSHIVLLSDSFSGSSLDKDSCGIQMSEIPRNC